VPALRKLHLDCLVDGAPCLEIARGNDRFLAVQDPGRLTQGSTRLVAWGKDCLLMRVCDAGAQVFHTMFLAI
jgi:hypothetical protein